MIEGFGEANLLVVVEGDPEPCCCRIQLSQPGTIHIEFRIYQCPQADGATGGWQGSLATKFVEKALGRLEQPR